MNQEPPGSSFPVATVVVATRDRPNALRRCLAALDEQTCEIEAIVVDDGSTDAGAVTAAVGAFPRTRLLRAAGQRLAAARNIGIAAARAPLVCFTDDDCEPAGDWAELLTAPLRDGADATVGRTVVADRTDRLIERAPARGRNIPSSQHSSSQDSLRREVAGHDLKLRPPG